MSDEEFDDVVTEAIANLPKEFKDALDDVEVFVEDLPSREQLAKVGLRGHYTLLGLYEGTPLEKRSVFQNSRFPDKITLFRQTIENHCPTREGMVEQIRRTLLHEIGHHFGMTDRELRELGY
jgi:predicted Zn-dependent protease with MMP-like domain